MLLRRLAIISAMYMTFAGLGFATLAMFAGDLYLMIGFEVLSLVGAVSWLVFRKVGAQ